MSRSTFPELYPVLAPERPPDGKPPQRRKPENRNPERIEPVAKEADPGSVREKNSHNFLFCINLKSETGQR